MTQRCTGTEKENRKGWGKYSLERVPESGSWGWDGEINKGWLARRLTDLLAGVGGDGQAIGKKPRHLVFFDHLYRHHGNDHLREERHASLRTHAKGHGPSASCIGPQPQLAVSQAWTPWRSLAHVGEYVSFPLSDAGSPSSCPTALPRPWQHTLFWALTLLSRRPRTVALVNPILQ